MENNEENLSSQEPKTNSAPVKSANIKVIGIIAAAIVVVLVLFLAFFVRSPKSTVKDYIKSIEKCDAGKMIELMDIEAVEAYNRTQDDLSKFDASYKEITDELKKASKEEKKEYEDAKEKAKDNFQVMLDLMKDAKIKYTIKNIKTEKVEGSKKLTKVICDIKITQDGKDTDLEKIEFYTVKKGLKNYIVVSPM